MKEIKSQKSVRKQMEKFIRLRDRYQKDIFFVLEENPESKKINSYCVEHKLNIDRMCDAVTYFKFKPHPDELIPLLLLNFIKDIGIITDEKINAVMKEIDENIKENEELDFSEYKNSVSLWKNYLHRDEKKALRMARVTASLNKKFYNYLVKRDYLIDYRNPENWHPQKREEYYKRLESRKRGSYE